MKTKRLIVLTLAVIVFSAILPALAKADSPKFYVISTASSSGKTTAVLSGRGASSSGWLGTPRSSGSSDAWVTSTIYNVFGKRVYAVRSGVHYSWSNGIVKTHTRYLPTLTVYVRIPATSCTMTKDWGPEWPFTWNGKVKGGWYSSVTMHVSQAIMKYGIYGKVDFFHQYKMQGNGRCWWKATS
ncbi:MAG: hypothetical protein NTV39_00020 [Candidatus Saccharibacteria bacterium]|nr:hypothetical protein [Candidatus Saccharibacteria bacterium]